ncbi:phosphoribosyltransferase [Streptomyces sp. NPDC087300]|uniref:phosphoribosyltransferase n=1 Tax=Streptomyces sp. NPDC087300 TaxID=3365780 RepID=UPI0037FE22B3
MGDDDRAAAPACGATVPRLGAPWEGSVAARLTWNDVHLMGSALAGRVSGDGRPDILIAVLRGGMVPATVLAHALQLRDVRALQIRHTIGEEIGAAKSTRPSVHHPGSLGNVSGRDVLIVDDVAGSGKTLEVARDLLAGLGAARTRTVALAVNRINWLRTHPDPPLDDPLRVLDYVGSFYAGWIICPWEIH